MKAWRWAVAAVGIMLILGSAARAATYYVDFEGGADENDGSSAQKAFKHCPGDSAAAGKAKAAALAPGDEVLFKGGVTYFGTVGVKASGEAGKPILFDGNSGRFGEGAAVIDGADPLSGWKRCASAEEAGGNPRWKDIFHVDVPRARNWNSLNLSDDRKPLPVAQDPNPKDPFLQEEPADYYAAGSLLANECPAKIYAEPNTHENSDRPLILLLRKDPPITAVVDPLPGAAVTVALPKPVTVTSVGFAPQPGYPAVKDVAFLGDGNELLRATLKKDEKALQRFDLPAPATFTKFTVKLLSAQEGEKGRYAAIRQIAAFTAEGNNVLDFPVRTTFADANILANRPPGYYKGMVFGFYGGPSMIEYLPVEDYVPAEGRFYLGFYAGRQYKSTKYCLLNSVRLIDVPGEYSVEPGGDEKTSRVFLLPEKVEGDVPVGVACSRRGEGFYLQGASHVVVQGFHVRRQGGFGEMAGIFVRGPGQDLVLRGCEVSLVRGGAGISVHRMTGVLVEGCHVHHCPGHTRGIVIQDSNDAITRDCLLVKNTSTALDYYTVTDGRVTGCTVLDHVGMHANGLTFYLSCRNILIDRNRVSRSNIGLTVQSAEDITIAQNIFDGGGKTLCVGVWTGNPMKNVHFFNNCLVRSAPEHQWMAALFSNNTGVAGLVVKNNVIDGLSGTLPGEYAHNIYTQWGPNLRDANPPKLGPGEVYEPDLRKIFVDPDKGDWRPKPGGPAIDAGTDVGLKEDIVGTKIPQGKAADIGVYENKE